MNQPYFQTSAWYHALTLTERIALVRTLQQETLNVGTNADFAECRLQRWRSQPPFTTGSYFAQRLAMDGISEDELRHLLGEPTEAIHDRFHEPTDWLAELAEAFSRPPSAKPIRLPEAAPGQERAGFLDVIEPLISQGRDRLHQGVQALIHAQTDVPFDPATVEDVLFANLPQQLIHMLSRTMALDLRVASLQGLLEGDAPEARFRSFVQRLRQREIALAILQEYPVLARQLTTCIGQWVSFSLEFLQNLCADWEAIRTTFSPGNDPGLLVQVNGMGDKHCGGRSVLIARFRSGFQAVYKPRSLAVDVHFQELLIWLNSRGDHPPFRSLKILARGSYGWVEFVAAKSCTCADEVRRFYERQGGYLALLYALEATDFHSENLIAAGEHPVLLDLEALFHSHVKGIDTQEADLIASTAITYSVMRVGLLPQRRWSNAESEGIDLSGLGAVSGQLTPQPIPYWEGAGTDEMRLARKRVAMKGTKNRPTLNDTEVNVLDYAEAIAVGFSSIYQLLVEHRGELLSSNGPLECFAKDEVRTILRSTRTYGLLLRESFHPDVLRNALDRDRLFDRLWVGVEHRPHLARAIPAERDDLLHGDIPMFTTCPESRDLWSSSHQRFTDFFDEPGINLVQHRIQALGADDLARQIWFIRASLVTLSTDMEQARWPIYHLTEPRTLTDHGRLLTAARAVGDRIEALALRGKHDVSWLGLRLANERHWSLVPLGADVYHGLPGIALFLAYMGAITREDRYTTLAEAGLATLRRQVERRRSFITSVGGFNGWGGVIYALTHLGVLWDDPALLVEAEGLVQLLPTLIERDENLDIIGGAAGCIGSMLTLYRCAPSERTLAAAIQCGDHLIARAQPMEPGIGWIPNFGGTRPLTGFSHGAAGMAWALIELAALTREERFRTAAIAAIAYERRFFSPEAGNWADLREVIPWIKRRTIDRRGL